VKNWLRKWPMAGSRFDWPKPSAFWLGCERAVAMAYEKPTLTSHRTVSGSTNEIIHNPSVKRTIPARDET